MRNLLHRSQKNLTQILLIFHTQCEFLSSYIVILDASADEIQQDIEQKKKILNRKVSTTPEVRIYKEKSTS